MTSIIQIDRRIQLVEADILDFLRRGTEASFDGVLCDPPYGLRIFGCDWDAEVPGAAVWTKLRRVLVPGAWLVAFASPRTHHRLMLSMEEGGLEIRDVAAWIFGTGFPKGPSSLKPAWQPIVFARRRGPVRALAIDRCRIPGAVLPSDERCSPRGRRTFWGTEGPRRSGLRHHPEGRWPGNLLLSHGPGCTPERCSPGCPVELLGGEGGPPRFFYCPKPAGREARGNDHPTQKPVRLTSHLAALIRWQGADRLLVPFCGSGSEVLGGLEAGWSSLVGIDREERWLRTARRRVREHGIEPSASAVAVAMAGGPALPKETRRPGGRKR